MFENKNEPLASRRVFIGVTGIAFAPVIHRVFHIFHLKDRNSRNPSEDT